MLISSCSYSRRHFGRRVRKKQWSSGAINTIFAAKWLQGNFITTFLKTHLCFLTCVIPCRPLVRIWVEWWYQELKLLRANDFTTWSLKESSWLRFLWYSVQNRSLRYEIASFIFLQTSVPIIDLQSCRFAGQKGKVKIFWT